MSKTLGNTDAIIERLAARDPEMVSQGGNFYWREASEKGDGWYEIEGTFNLHQIIEEAWFAGAHA